MPCTGLPELLPERWLRRASSGGSLLVSVLPSFPLPQLLLAPSWTSSAHSSFLITSESPMESFLGTVMKLGEEKGGWEPLSSWSFCRGLLAFH